MIFFDKSIYRKFCEIIPALSSSVLTIFTNSFFQFIEPCKQLNLTVSGLSMFLQALMTTCEKLSSVQKYVPNNKPYV